MPATSVTKSSHYVSVTQSSRYHYRIIVLSSGNHFCVFFGGTPWSKVCSSKISCFNFLGHHVHHLIALSLSSTSSPSASSCTAIIILINVTRLSGGGGTRYLSWSVGGKQHYLCSLQVILNLPHSFSIFLTTSYIPHVFIILIFRVFCAFSKLSSCLSLSSWPGITYYQQHYKLLHSSKIQVCRVQQHPPVLCGFDGHGLCRSWRLRWSPHPRPPPPCSSSPCSPSSQSGWGILFFICTTTCISVLGDDQPSGNSSPPDSGWSEHGLLLQPVQQKQRQVGQCQVINQFALEIYGGYKNDSHPDA